MNQDKQITSSFVRAFRAKNRITQDDLGKMLGYSRSMIAQIENDMSAITPRPQKLLKYVIEEYEHENTTRSN